MYSDFIHFFSFRGNWRILFTITWLAMASNLISVHVDQDFFRTAPRHLGTRSKRKRIFSCFWHEGKSLSAWPTSDIRVRRTRGGLDFNGAVPSQRLAGPIYQNKSWDCEKMCDVKSAQQQNVEHSRGVGGGEIWTPGGGVGGVGVTIESGFITGVSEVKIIHLVSLLFSSMRPSVRPFVT